MTRRQYKHTVIDLFAGCGGLSLGLYQAGWKGLFAIEKNAFAFDTLKHNLIDKKHHFDWPDWLPQTNHDINEVLENFENQLKSLRGTVDLVAGGPPCQGFSTANRHQKEVDDPRNKLFFQYIRFVEVLKPKVVLIENVRGILTRDNGYAKDHLNPLLLVKDFYSKIGVSGENDSEHLMWNYDRRGEKFGELRVSENGVRLFKDGDGWTMLVGLSLYDSNPFATYSSIAKCFTYMHEQSEIYEAQEDSSLARTLLSNNNEDQDCPF